MGKVRLYHPTARCTRKRADRQRGWHRHLHLRLPTLGPGTLTFTPILTIPIPIITYPTIQPRSSTTMKRLPLLPGLSWSVSCSPSSPVSLCSADSPSPLVSACPSAVICSLFALAIIVGAIFYLRHQRKARSTRVRSQSASLERKYSGQSLAPSLAPPPPLPVGPRDTFEIASGQPTSEQNSRPVRFLSIELDTEKVPGSYAAQTVLNALSAVYSPQPNDYSPPLAVEYSATRDTFKIASGQPTSEQNSRPVPLHERIPVECESDTELNMRGPSRKLFFICIIYSWFSLSFLSRLKPARRRPEARTVWCRRLWTTDVDTNRVKNIGRLSSNTTREHDNSGDEYDNTVDAPRTQSTAGGQLAQSMDFIMNWTLMYATGSCKGFSLARVLVT